MNDKNLSVFELTEESIESIDSGGTITTIMKKEMTQEYHPLIDKYLIQSKAVAN